MKHLAERLGAVTSRIDALDARLARLHGRTRADAEQWVTINSAKVLLGEDGSVQGGAGGKLSGRKFPAAKGTPVKSVTPPAPPVAPPPPPAPPPAPLPKKRVPKAKPPVAPPVAPPPAPPAAPRAPAYEGKHEVPDDSHIPPTGALRGWSDEKFAQEYGIAVRARQDGTRTSLSESWHDDKVLGISRRAVAALPEAHRAVLKGRVDVNVVPMVRYTGSSTTGLGAERAAGVFQGRAVHQPGTTANVGSIQVATTWQIGSSGERRAGRNFSGTTTHEIAHALDYALGVVSRDSRFIDAIPPVSQRGTTHEQARSKYWHLNTSETFAECYAAAFSQKALKDTTYFGGMSRERVLQIYGKAINVMKTLIDEKIAEHEKGLATKKEIKPFNSLLDEVLNNAAKRRKRLK